jgi:hypothetical protein
VNVPCVLFHLDKGVASVGAFDEGEGVAFASLDTSALAIDEVERVVGCECWVSLLIDVEVVTYWWISRAVGKEVVERIETFWPISQGSH